MIAVIADDLTGAAEIGGIALRHGLRVVMDTKVHNAVDTDVLIIATDSRSKTSAEAKAVVAEVTTALLALQPELIFKKTDSLLRGHVAEELLAQMKASNKKRVLLIPANPALGRTIKDGIYYAGDVPLNQSDLADAFRKKIATADVRKMMGDDFSDHTQVISLNGKMPDKAFVIGNTSSEKDLDGWASRLDDEIIPAGSGGFFNAVLNNRIKHKRDNHQEELALGKKVIYVCGSAFPASKASVAAARAAGENVAYMPEAIFCSDAERIQLIDGWAKEIVSALKQSEKVIIAVDKLKCSDMPDLSNQIKQMIATVAEKVVQQTAVDELVIEGGATASAIIEKLHYQRFFPAQEMAQGVLRMKVQEAPGLHLTMKPGSYQWPVAVWKTV